MISLYKAIIALVQVQERQNEILGAISKYLAEISKCLMAEAKKGETK